MSASARCYHRNLNGIEAERLLKEYGQDGSFLLRPSQSTVNSYTLSVRCGDVCKHVKIQNNGEFYEIGEGGDKFATLHELVEYFIMKETLRDKSDGTMLILKYPMSYKEPTSERYFHGAISGADAANLLLTKGKFGSYLVRESQSDPQNYVLCLRCENDKIVHLMINYTEHGYTMQNFEKCFPTLDEFINECRNMGPIADVKNNVLYLKQPLCATQVNLENFETRVRDLEKPSKNNKEKNGFSEEFESLQEGYIKYLFERKDGFKPENRSKNRFKTILPFDHTRVKILTRTNNPDDPSTSDYINANYMSNEFKFEKDYIATQGPLPNTIIDFWEMIWQEECHFILMITHEEEKGKIKCARYWPDENGAVINYGPIQVKAVSFKQAFDDYLLRQFEISRIDQQQQAEPRTVYHFQYLAWSDHGVPENVQNTLNFIEHVNELYNLFPKKPITIHCCAGIGRTGAVIVIDRIIDKMKTHGLKCDVDIYRSVGNLRSQRSGMIQTEKQYQFLYMAINQYIVNFHQKKKHQQQQLTSIRSGHSPAAASTPIAVYSNSNDMSNGIMLQNNKDVTNKHINGFSQLSIKATTTTTNDESFKTTKKNEATTKAVISSPPQSCKNHFKENKLPEIYATNFKKNRHNTESALQSEACSKTPLYMNLCDVMPPPPPSFEEINSHIKKKK